MSAEDDNRAVARRFRQDLWNSGDLAIADEIIASGCIIEARVPLTTDFARGPDAIRQLILFYHLAFTDIRVTIDQMIAEGDLVATRWTARGKHKGDLLGIPPSDHDTVTSGIDMLRIKGGKIVEGWVSWDTLSLLEQLAADSAAAAGPAGGPAASPHVEFLSLLNRLR
ncbi:MAG TPA: ester cyclase [Thermoanaerobaculia bacterium]|nr:ester cyclase [Thermoanaerobaculia bacterium]